MKKVIAEAEAKSSARKILLPFTWGTVLFSIYTVGDVVPEPLEENSSSAKKKKKRNKLVSKVGHLLWL